MRNMAGKHKLVAGFGSPWNGGRVLGSNIIGLPDGAYTGGGWVQDGSTIPQSQNQTDPFGGSLASLVQATATTAVHRLYQANTVLTAPPFRVSIYAKPGTASFLGVSGQSAAAYAVFNLGTGAVASAVGVLASGIAAAANGFFYCWYELAALDGFYKLQLGTTAGQAIPDTSWTGAGTENLTVIRASLQPYA